ncbi:phosphatidylinositol-4 kinase [Scheffersomyces coipomensis]|uniref:phosphatidylinositol-4 kinase n=1 Tax=Scheffersomyces coipomensis TaxID=1788519 RepID=UPI00315DDC0A
MDFNGISRGSIRAESLRKLSKLSVQQLSSNETIPNPASNEDFNKVLTWCGKETDVDDKDLAVESISIREYEVLIALCESTVDLKFTNQAKLLIKKFRVYLLDLQHQKFSYSIATKSNKISPWANLAQHLTTALCNISRQFNHQFQDDVINVFTEFTDKFFAKAYDERELTDFFTILGYIEGLTQNSQILIQTPKSFKLFTTLDACIDNVEFLNDIEFYSSAVHKEDNDYTELLDHSYMASFSPILYIEKISYLMTSILNSILGNKSGPLINYILDKASAKYLANEEEAEEEVVDENGFSLAKENLDISQQHMEIIKNLSHNAISKMEFLDRGETYIVYSSYERLKHGYLAKAHNIQILSCGMFTDIVDIKIAKKFFKNCLQIKQVMLDPDLGLSVLQLGALLVFKDDKVGPSLTRGFTSLIANPKVKSDYSIEASKCVGLASKVLTQDSIVTTIYALTNLVFVGNDGLQLQSRNSIRKLGPPQFKNGGASTNGTAAGEFLSLSRRTSISSFPNNGSRSNLSVRSIAGEYDENDYNKVCQNAVSAVIEIAQACNDETIPTLAVTILSQKITKVDSPIGELLLKGLVSCAPFLPEREFIILSKLLNRLSLEALEKKNHHLLANLTNARVSLSHKLTPENPLFQVYLHEILQAIISRGDVQVLDHHRSHNEISEIGDQIAIYLKPLSELLPDVNKNEKPLEIKNTETINLFRNIWFNMVVHGYSINAPNSKRHIKELERIAYNSPPLASELSWDRTETTLELNTVLRRGSSNSNVKDHRHIIGDIFEVHRTMSYQKLMFLAATVFVESLRVKSGDCSTILHYYSDPSIKTSGIEKYIGYIAFKIVRDYIILINNGANKQFSSDNISEQLTNMLALCCHRLEDLQDAAIQCCDLLINKVPSSLCHSLSLFSLFDLLTLLFDSIVDAETNQYEPTTSFTADRTGIQLLLSDSYTWRDETFKRFNEKSKHWVRLILLKSNVDVKSLIQTYVTDVNGFQSGKKVEYGVSFALEMAGSVLGNDRQLSSMSRITARDVNTLPSFVAQLSWRSAFISDLKDANKLNNVDDLFSIRSRVEEFKSTLFSTFYHQKPSDQSQKNLLIKQQQNDPQEYIKLLTDIAGFTLLQEQSEAETLRYLVEIPFMLFDSNIMNIAIGIWFTIMKDRPNLSGLLLSEIAKKWETSIELKKGLFSTAFDIENPEFDKMEYAPSDRKAVNKLSQITERSFDIHLHLIKLFSSNFEATLNQSDHLLKLFTRFIEIGLKNLLIASLHPYSRFIRFELIKYSFDVLNYHNKLGSRSILYLTELIFDAALSWFKGRANYPYGGNLLKIKGDYGLLKDVAKLVQQSPTYKSESLSYKKTILLYFLDDEISKISVWLDPLSSSETKGSFISNQSQISSNILAKSYAIDPILAINLSLRYKIKNLDETLQSLISNNTLAAIYYPEAVQYYIGINAEKSSLQPHYHLLFWEPLSPIDCITLFLPPFGNNPYVLQYTMRSLESHDVNITFFYVPQIVQSLRYDAKGYVERFILETAQVSQLFSHQIIWNMLANSYKDDESQEPDSIKPILDRIQQKMTSSFNERDLKFYEREFGFFAEVTSISGKLKPYIKKSKAEKKEKIDEEMFKIKVKAGVYLPSNPDGTVIDINRKSGRPLQSHAKAPFMATFKIRKEIHDIDEFGEPTIIPIEKWQGAIFKVGDDCRQDVLAIQLISIFRTIWTNAGLDLYVFPYRVTATAPGCGVIDVLPNATSRDMLGREAVNGLYEYFITKFGPENSIEFQQARNNLIKSLAAYSIISYLLQFKDRHNGNIMYDDQGHVLHIDFGFCFDIVPGGVKFEVAPFKLTHEMILVLGGRDDTQAFKWFEELCVKGYLACRPYMETIVRCVNPMLESGLPCFKENTVKKLRQRFVPGKSEREAGQFFRGLIKKSMESFYTKGYDEFQRLTNGIPY